MSEDANDMLEQAVKVAMARNSKSSIMFLLRERLIREVIETAIPIVIQPYLKRIAELEQALEECDKKPSEVVSESLPKVGKSNLKKMKEAVEDVKEIIEDDDPPVI